MIEFRAERTARRGNERAVEGGGDLQLFPAQVATGKQGRRPVDLGQATGQHDLIRTVVVGHHEIDGQLFDCRFDLSEWCADGQHSTVHLLRLGHQSPP